MLSFKHSQNPGQLLLASLFAGLLALFSASALIAQEEPEQQFVCLDTSLGVFCIELYADVAPQTVNNFLNYVNSGRYDDTFFHRVVRGFVVQGGGFSWSAEETESGEVTGIVEVPKDPPVINEFNLSNLRGTVAMAKMGGDPNSATSEWFVNLFDNGDALDFQNGGFTVFGKVAGNGMLIVEAIAARIIRNLSSLLGPAFETLPMIKYEPAFNPDDLIRINRAYVITDPDEVPVSVLPSGTGFFDGISLYVPVLYRGVLYRFIFDVVSFDDDGFVFWLRTSQIVRLNDTGQERAIFLNNRLSIPSVLFGADMWVNVELEMTNSQVFEMTLVSYEIPEPEEEDDEDAVDAADAEDGQPEPPPAA